MAVNVLIKVRIKLEKIAHSGKQNHTGNCTVQNCKKENTFKRHI